VPSIWRWDQSGESAPDRRLLHRVLSQWLDLDHHGKTKPWSWSAHREPSGWVVEVGLVDDALVQRLVQRSEAYRTGGRRPAGYPRLTRPLCQVAAVPWSRLVASSGAGEWTVRFVSPFTARRGNRFVPWPAPATVFGSLRASWRTFAAPHVGDLELDLSLEPLVVTALDGSSVVEKVPLKAQPEPAVVTVGGFLGCVRYTADGPVDVAAVESLLRLAPFCGAGAYTTRGFGAVRPAGAR
jgi:CRISPR-associated endoribonuclease Cas6